MAAADVIDGKYHVNLTYRSSAKSFPSIRGELLENNIIICRFSRGRVIDGYIPPIKYKFLSDASRVRFDDYADCISIPEAIEALIGIL